MSEALAEAEAMLRQLHLREESATREIDELVARRADTRRQIEYWVGRLVCHCGRPVTYGYDGNPTHHRGMCADCDATRCDAYPQDCPHRGVARAMPDTSSGHFGSERAIREYLNGPPQPIITLDVPDIAAPSDENGAFPRWHLVVRKCEAPAPFVGDPRIVDGRYVWRVAITDDGQRYVAGSASLVLGPAHP